MSDDANGTELVYVPASSWLPAFTAIGIALILAGLWTSWVVGVIGAVIALAAIVGWMRDIGDEVARMPIEQGSLTAVLPAEAGEAD